MVLRRRNEILGKSHARNNQVGHDIASCKVPCSNTESDVEKIEDTHQVRHKLNINIDGVERRWGNVRQRQSWIVLNGWRPVLSSPSFRLLLWWENVSASSKSPLTGGAALEGLKLLRCGAGKRHIHKSSNEVGWIAGAVWRVTGNIDRRSDVGIGSTGTGVAAQVLVHN